MNLWSRRQAACLMIAMFAGCRDALALGRTRLGGRLHFGAPWSLSAVDPHDPFDAVSAIYSSAIVDTLFTTDAKGVALPALADGQPIVDKGGCIIKLRPGLLTAAGVGLDARDVVFSLTRARRAGALPELASFSEPRTQPKEPLHLVFARGDKMGLMRTLSSPLAGIVPRGFDPKKPDGTGPFRAELEADRLVLTRNSRAALGPAFLERITIHQTPDLVTSLRDFETERHDLAWFGAGLHGPRPGSKSFDFGRAGWFALFVGGELGGRGEAQRLADRLPRQSLAHLGLGVLPEKSSQAYRGKPCDLLVEHGSAHLLELAQALATLLSSPGHEVTMKLTSRAEVLRRVRRNDSVMAVVVVRPLSRGTWGDALALRSLVDPDGAERLTKGRESAAPSAREVGATMSVGIVGELRVAGAMRAGLRLSRASTFGIDFGASSTSA